MWLAEKLRNSCLEATHSTFCRCLGRSTWTPSPLWITICCLDSIILSLKIRSRQVRNTSAATFPCGMGDSQAEVSQLVGPHTVKCMNVPTDGVSPAWGVTVGGTVGSLNLPWLRFISSLAIRANYQYSNPQCTAGRCWKVGD